MEGENPTRQQQVRSRDTASCIISLGVGNPYFNGQNSLFSTTGS